MRVLETDSPRSLNSSSSSATSSPTSTETPDDAERRWAFLIGCIIGLPEIIAILVVNLVEPHTHCDRPLRAWAAAECVRETLLLSALGFSYVLRRGVGGAHERPPNFFETLTEVVKMVCAVAAFVLFIIGASFVFSTKSCRKDSPHLFYLCLSLVLAAYMFLLLPCVLVLIHAPPSCLLDLSRSRTIGANETICDSQKSAAHRVARRVASGRSVLHLSRSVRRSRSVSGPSVRPRVSFGMRRRVDRRAKHLPDLSRSRALHVNTRKNALYATIYTLGDYWSFFS